MKLPQVYPDRVAKPHARDRSRLVLTFANYRTGGFIGSISSSKTQCSHPREQAEGSSPSLSRLRIASRQVRVYAPCVG
jgi:hypothetical protein